VRFCTAAEEILRLTDRRLAAAEPRPPKRARGEARTGGSAWQADPHGWRNIQPAPGLKGWTRLPMPPTNSLGAQQWMVTTNGTLLCNGDTGHEMLRWDREIADGVLHVEFRFPAEGTNTNFNSGVFLRNSRDGTVWHQAQLTPKGGYWFGNSPTNGEPRRFKLAPAEDRMKPLGEWNTLEVTARGAILTLWLNGAVTCRMDDCRVPRGYLALESEGYAVEFRNLRVKVRAR
jgi:hypothetical protein